MTSSTAVDRGAGVQQSRRILWFGAALLAFALFTAFAFRPKFDGGTTASPAFLTTAWWLRPIEFNRAARANRIEPGVDFTCISTLEGKIWVGGSKGVIILSSDGGRTWAQLPKVAAAPAIPRPRREPPAGASGASSDRASHSEIQQIALQEERPKDEILNQAYPSKESVPNAANQAAPTPDFPIQKKLEPQPTASPEPSVTPQELLSNDLIDLQFVSQNSAYAVTARGEVLSTRDGGKTWRLSLPYYSLGGAARRIKFLDETRGVVVGEFGISTPATAGKSGANRRARPPRPPILP